MSAHQQFVVDLEQEILALDSVASTHSYYATQNRNSYRAIPHDDHAGDAGGQGNRPRVSTG
ncbi:MAG: hypothetical protein R2849_18875 [Thermomicrobiales bacterium]